ncbi:hypothetical protein ACWCPS_38310, partial [Streptomyces mauvecolor]
FWHAVEFSRNGRFLRTHPLGLSSGRFPSVFRVSSLADPISRFCHPLERAADSISAFAFPFSATPTLSEAFRPTESASLTSNDESKWLIIQKFNFR